MNPLIPTLLVTLVATMAQAQTPVLLRTFNNPALFSLNGTLLATINNPTPGVGDRFGMRLVAFGNDSVLIAAPGNNGAGSAYLFSIPAPATPPSLTIRRATTNTVVVSWLASATGFVLQQNTNGVNSVNWSNVTAGIQNDGPNKSLVVTPAGSRFYRLSKF